jgi:parvulin-like peptidyl-prolyl isomerase
MGCRRAGLSIVRTRDQAFQRAQEVLAKVRGGQDLGRLAMDYSDEEGAGARGGSLGCFGHGMMDKKFEQAAFALQPGEVSDVVETPFGFHVIQRTE